jgi:hypothetical protein
MRETIERSHVESRTQKKHKRPVKTQVKAEELRQIRKENIDMTDYIAYVENECAMMLEDATPVMTYIDWLKENGR